ncbi:NAD(P)H-dependent oxidoreductase [Kordiimonas aquimaris]|uniref:NAD(P)H-dependent oxidoreductase n=1 Tax=Kordiimonas aquimaris TaxID=707591 RepID=UPI0021D2A350|nr:NAD(P)H-dependent oxidoreductase [Kordiimonas aquimaris]
MKKITLIYAHPSPHKSRYNRSLMMMACGLPYVEVRDLYELYPSMLIDEQAEQNALRDADALVFQFPIYWFSAPSIIKEWQDAVLQNGFAYGDGGNVLAGKKFMIAASTGGSQSAYNDEQSHGAPVADYLKPIEMTARYCGMDVVDAFVTHEARSLDYQDIKGFSAAYCKALSALIGETCPDG